MGFSLTRIALLLALLPALPAGAEGVARATDPSALPTSREGLPPTPGLSAEALQQGHAAWMQQRLGRPGAAVSQRVVREAAKVRAAHPTQFQQPSRPLFGAAGGVGIGGPGGLNGSAWTNLGPTDATFTQQQPTTDGWWYSTFPKMGTAIKLNKVDSGRLSAILPDATDASGNTVYVLASGGGLWKATDFLTDAPTWVPKTDNAVPGAMWGALAQGGAAGTLYVGTGDAYEPGVGGSMITSTDGGDTWSAPVQLGQATCVLSVQVDTSTGSDIVLAGTDRGMFRSTNGGATYTAVPTLTGQGFVWSLVRTSAGWLATQEQPDPTGPGFLFLSTDQGATWALLDDPVYRSSARTTLAVGAPGEATVYAYAGFYGVWGDQGWMIYDMGPNRGLLRSDDGGLSWRWDRATWWNDISGDRPLRYQALVVDPMDAGRSTVYLGGHVYSQKTTNAGAVLPGGTAFGDYTYMTNWAPGITFSSPYDQMVPDPVGMGALPYVHAGFHCGAASVLGGVARIYLGTDGGLFTSTDGGATWDDTKNRGLTTHLVEGISGNAAHPDSVLAGIRGGGIRVREGATGTFDQVLGGDVSGGSALTQPDTPTDGSGVGWGQAPGGVALATNPGGLIWRSTTNPSTDATDWSPYYIYGGMAYYSGETGYPAFDFDTPIITPTAKADTSGQVFFTYTNSLHYQFSNSIFRSRPDGSGWDWIFQEGARGIPIYRSMRSVPHGLGVSPLDLNHLAGAGSLGFLFLTSDAGLHWHEVFLGDEGPDFEQANSLYEAGYTDLANYIGSSGAVPGWQGHNACVAWVDSTRFYMCSEAPGAGATRVIYSPDGGAHFQRVDAGLPDVPVTQLVVDPGDSTGSTVYAATWIGVYRTTDGGANWEPFGVGLPQLRVTDMWLAPDSSVLRVATWGRGIWEIKSDFSDGAISVGPAFTSLYTNQTQAFSAAVFTNGAFVSTPVGWTASGGTVDSTGLFTAPASAGTVTVTATNALDGSKAALATVVVKEPAIDELSLSPGQVNAMSGGRLTFTTAVKGGPDTSVDWTASAGTVDAHGVLTAPILVGTYTVTATSHQDPSKSATATVTVGAVSGNLLVNAGFEDGLALPDGWTQSSSTLFHQGNPTNTNFNSYSETLAHGGVNYVQLGGTGLTHTDTLSQTVYLPTSLSAATLSFWAKVYSADTGSTAHDTLSVEVQAMDGTLLQKLGTLSNLDRTGPANGGGAVWTQHQFALNPAPYAGQQVQIVLKATEDNSLPTYFVLDDFSLSATAAPNQAYNLDLNADGVVNVNDLLVFAKSYDGTYHAACDFDGDHIVTDLDLAILLAGL